MATATASRAERWQAALHELAAQLPKTAPIAVEGRLCRAVGLTLEASGLRLPVGGRCRIAAEDGQWIPAQVVGFNETRSYLMPAGEAHGLVMGAAVRAERASGLSIGDEWLGRVIDASGAPLDGRPAPRGNRICSLLGAPLNPLNRQPITQPLDVGVRAINAALTLGRGQRIGLFAGAGVGKSTLLGMMTRHTQADVIVVGLVGERGREVAEFVQRTLGPDGLTRAVVVATPSDRPPLMRLHGAWLATAVAEYFRDRGQQVLLLMDSLTRFAQAAREVGLAIGEPPATRGYPPSVFAHLARLCERAGPADRGAGSITAVYTVLAEGDDLDDPVADSARSILDGHIILSRELADGGIFPAIDIERSISRLMPEITDEAQQKLVRDLRALIATYQRNRDLIAIGAYKTGSDPRIDAAIDAWPRVEAFLRQPRNTPSRLADVAAELQRVVQPPAPAPAKSAK
ncbi:MAG: FliI/YscN family ATPase [Nevskiaceae bacterium]|nr:MAG: FliI/YscN family ATPase [Nevskiaceae bacterium]TBR72196.1 MAG: FliI/YscN family ATPase [Nevskiaceae bacterium]